MCHRHTFIERKSPPLVLFEPTGSSVYVGQSTPAEIAKRSANPVKKADYFDRQHRGPNRTYEKCDR